MLLIYKYPFECHRENTKLCGYALAALCVICVNYKGSLVKPISLA